MNAEKAHCINLVPWLLPVLFRFCSPQTSNRDLCATRASANSKHSSDPNLPTAIRRSYFNSAGTGMVTAPVAAHSVPRSSVMTKPGLGMGLASWPSAVWKTRPIP